MLFYLVCNNVAFLWFGKNLMCVCFLNEFISVGESSGFGGEIPLCFRCSRTPAGILCWFTHPCVAQCDFHWVGYTVLTVLASWFRLCIHDSQDNRGLVELLWTRGYHWEDVLHPSKTIWGRSYVPQAVGDAV